MKCSVCGKEIEKSSFSGKILCDSSDCFKENFWQDIIKNRKNYIFINKKSYSLGENPLYKGFSGKTFKIKLLENGKIIKTNDLRHQGDIPLKYQNTLKDNAMFV